MENITNIYYSLRANSNLQFVIEYKDGKENNMYFLTDENINISTTLNNLASIYDNQGKYKKAEQSHRNSLEIDLVIIQEEAPYLVLSERKTFSNSFLAHLVFHYKF